MKNLPNSIAEAKATGSKYVTGNVSLVAAEQGLNIIGVVGGENPGQYVIGSKVSDGMQVALTALTNKAKVWGPLNDNNELVTLAVYTV